jgi:hypothetical protein
MQRGHLRPQQVPAQVVEQLRGVQAGVEALVGVQLAAGVVRQLPQRRRVHKAAAQYGHVDAYLRSRCEPPVGSGASLSVPAGQQPPERLSLHTLDCQRPAAMHCYDSSPVHGSMRT